jgi:uncharacterized protein (TIGR02271 family)
METGTTNTNIPWDEVIKKEARGIDDYDLGEVQQVTSEYVLTQKGLVNTRWFQIPKTLAQEFDGSKLVFKIIKDEAKNLYEKDVSPMDSEELETTVPLIEERLEPKKKEVVEEATIIKEPVKENKEVEVSLTHEELVLERNPLSEPRPTDENPVDTRTEIKVPLKREEVHSTKQSYVKEEVIVKKKPVTETRTVTEELTSETIKDD